MTTEPTHPRPIVSSPPRTVSQSVTTSAPLAVLGAVLTIALGLALGLANQVAGGTQMGLRVPALLAALLMVGQGVNDLRKNLPSQQRIELVQDAELGPRGRELAVVPSPPPKLPVTVLAVKQAPVNLGIPITVMLLAAWLGLADLRIAAPDSLSVLSLVAAFALFALGWGLLPART